MNKAKLYMFISFGILLFSVSGSLAWIVWKSTNSALVNLEVCAPLISFIGGSTITGEDLVPVLSKEEGLKKEIDVKLNSNCKEGDTAVMNIHMNLELLPEELQEETFIYELYQGEELIKNDNFKDKVEGDTIRLVENEVVAEDKLTYTLYIYIDGNRDNPITMASKGFRFSIYGEGTDAIYEENYLRSTGDTGADSLFLNTDIKREEIESITTVDNNIIPEGVLNIFDISSKEDGTVMLWYTDDNGDGLYEVYMGGENGSIKLSSGGTLFANLTNAKELDLSKLDTSKLTSMRSMFAGCQNLNTIDLSNFDTSNVTNMSFMFYSCNNLLNLNLDGFDTSKVIYMNSMFNGCTNLKSLSLHNFNTENVTSMGSMFAHCESLEELDLRSFHNSSKLTGLSGMFWECYKLRNIYFDNFNTSGVTTMNRMFWCCSVLESLDLSSFDTTNVENMADLFYGCHNLTELDISSFRTPNLTAMSQMFRGCHSLKKLDLSNFNTENITNMTGLFNNCYNLKELDISSLDASKVIYMNSMFGNCRSLKSLDLRHFNTENVNNMGSMFWGCSLLETLDLSSFDTSEVTNMTYMIRECSKLKELNIKNFSFDKIETCTSMFQGTYPGVIYVSNNNQKSWLEERFTHLKNIVILA